MGQNWGAYVRGLRNRLVGMQDGTLCQFARDAARLARMDSPSASQVGRINYRLAWDELRDRKQHLRVV